MTCDKDKQINQGRLRIIPRDGKSAVIFGTIIGELEIQAATKFKSLL